MTNSVYQYDANFIVTKATFIDRVLGHIFGGIYYFEGESFHVIFKYGKTCYHVEPYSANKYLMADIITYFKENKPETGLVTLPNKVNATLLKGANGFEARNMVTLVLKQ